MDESEADDELDDVDVAEHADADRPRRLLWSR